MLARTLFIAVCLTAVVSTAARSVSAIPETAAVISAVAPSALAVLGPAPASSIALTMAGLPFLQAISSGVMAPIHCGPSAT